MKTFSRRLGPPVELDVGDDRRVVEDDAPAVDDGRQRLEGPHAVSPAGLGEDGLEPLAPLGGGPALEAPGLPRPPRGCPTSVMRGVPDVDQAHRRRSEPSTGGSCAPPPSSPRGSRVALKPLAGPAMMTLAARRFTSHSQGPGRVSSKSLASKTRVRSGEANSPKFERWASPLAWTRMSVRGVVGEVEGHDRRRAAVVGEGRFRHPLVAKGQQIRQAILLLGRQDGDRVATGRGSKAAWLVTRHPLAGRLARFGPFDGVDPRPRGPHRSRRRLDVPGGVIGGRRRFVGGLGRSWLPGPGRGRGRFGHHSRPPGVPVASRTADRSGYLSRSAALASAAWAAASRATGTRNGEQET